MGAHRPTKAQRTSASGKAASVQDEAASPAADLKTLSGAQLLQRTVGNRALASGEPGATASRFADSREAIVQRTTRAGAAVKQKGVANGTIQRAIGPGAVAGADLVKHEPQGDKPGYQIAAVRKVIGNTVYDIKETAADPIVVKGVSPSKQEWGLVTNQAESRKTYDTWLQKQAPVAAFDYASLLTGNFPKNDFRYWFYYLLQQVSGNDKKLPFVERTFQPAPGHQLKITDPAAQKAILTEMFQIGFVTFENLEKEMTTSAKTVKLVKSGSSLFGTAPVDGAEIGFGFRGDSRDPNTLKMHGGFGTKADSNDAAFRAREGLDQDWNPFKTPEQLPGWAAAGYNGFFRRDDKDNDLVTVVSVTPNWLDATKFPMLEENYVPPEDVSYKGKSVKRTRSYVYMMIVEKGFDTKTAQGSNAFPEIATRSIPWQNHLACFYIDRYHHGATANDGHIVTVTKTELGRSAKDHYEKTPMWKSLVAKVKEYSDLKDKNYDPATAVG